MGKAGDQPCLLALWPVRGAGGQDRPSTDASAVTARLAAEPDQPVREARSLSSAGGRGQSCEVNALDKQAQNKVCLAVPTPSRPIGHRHLTFTIIRPDASGASDQVAEDADRAGVYIAAEASTLAASTA